jgi:hypothetical protein
MTTSTLHFEVERSRFANLLLAALGAAVPASLASLLGRDRNESAAAPVDKAAIEAAAVREMARSYAKTDPSFAADLYAAADRHEALNDE